MPAFLRISLASTTAFGSCRMSDGRGRTGLGLLGRMPSIPARTCPLKMALSSANAIFFAASTTLLKSASSAPRAHRIELHDRQLDGDADLEERLDEADAEVHVIRDFREERQATGVDGCILPAERTEKVDHLSAGKTELEDSLRFGVDERPRFGEDGGEAPFQEIHVIFAPFV